MLCDLPADILEAISDLLQSAALSHVNRQLWELLQYRHLAIGLLGHRKEKATFSKLEGFTSRISSLTLRWVTGDSTGIGQVASFPEMESLGWLCHLSLHLRATQISDEDMTGLAALKNMVRLESLHIDLSFNLVGPPGWQSLVTVGEAPSLRSLHLNLSHNAYFQKHRLDGLAFAEALVELRRMPRLHTLILSLNDNSLGPLGAKALVALKAAPSLHSLVLDLGWNDIGDMGAIALADLATSESLQSLTLDLRDNYVHQGGWEALQRLSHNARLRSFVLRL